MVTTTDVNSLEVIINEGLRAHLSMIGVRSQCEHLPTGPNGYPIPDPNPKFLSIPEPDPIFFFKIIGYFGYRVFQKILTFASI